MSKGERYRRRRRELPVTDPTSQAVRAIDGAAIPGGCEHCNAFQRVTADAFGANLHSVSVHHDPWCPKLRNHIERTEQS